MPEDRRKYRFRCWVQDERKLYPVLSIVRGGIVALKYGVAQTYTRREIDLMQYSGFLDAKNREIYEKDIVELKPIQANSKAEPIMAEVMFEGGAFRLQPIGEFKSEPALIFDEAMLKDWSVLVLGTIYDHTT